MLFLLVSALLQSSGILAAPASSEPLSIPISDIIRKDLSSHEGHPYFEAYRRWLETPVGSHVTRDPESMLDDHPSLDSIECHGGESACLLVSRVSFPSNMDRQLGLEEGELGARSEAESRGFWTGESKDLFSSTHLKTYEGNDDDVSVPIGQEHYLDMNLKCNTLDYRSTGFAMKGWNVKAIASNHHVLQANVVGYNDPNLRVVITQSYGCGLFSDQCCLSHWETQLFINDAAQYFDRDSTCECASGHSVADQKCDSYTPGWCGVHVTQYQKNEGPGEDIENYRFTVVLKDADGKPVGEQDLVSIASGDTSSFTSTLPWTFDLTAPNVDDDAIWMAYGDQSFTSNDQPHSCNFGSYDGGKREGDCGFTCD